MKWLVLLGLVAFSECIVKYGDCKSHHIPFSDFSFHLIILLLIRFRTEWNSSLTILKFNPFLLSTYSIGNVGPKVLGVDLHIYTTLGSNQVMTY